MAKRLPPFCGELSQTPIIFQPTQQAFQDARRLRFCKACGFEGRVVIDAGVERCSKCQAGLIARAYRHLAVICGRQSGKTLNGAYALREELTIPNKRWWVCGPTYPILYDSTLPTLTRLLPPEWVRDWHEDRLDLLLINNTLVQFRSLDDPTRAHGPGLDGLWLDEAGGIPVQSWYELRPTLATRDAVILVSTSSFGRDWVYDTFWVPAMVEHRPGYWAGTWWSSENPVANPEELEQARRSMPPVMYRRQYEASFENFEGAVYGDLIDAQTLRSAEDVKKFLPEWPNIDPSRDIGIGLDSGADHPFGATLRVSTEKGLLYVADYLERQASYATHIRNIHDRLTSSFTGNKRFSANRNEAQLRLEFAQYGLNVAPVDANQEAGIQRVHWWLAQRQVWFVAGSAGGHFNADRTIKQLQNYRYADNRKSDGSKRDKELVVKLDDELPDAVRYDMQGFPTLPKSVEASTERDLSRLPARTREDIEHLRAYEKAQARKDIDPWSKGYPVTEMWGYDAAVD